MYSDILLFLMTITIIAGILLYHFFRRSKPEKKMGDNCFEMKVFKVYQMETQLKLPEKKYS